MALTMQDQGQTLRLFADNMTMLYCDNSGIIKSRYINFFLLLQRKNTERITIHLFIKFS